MFKAILFDIDGVLIRHKMFFSESLSTKEYAWPVETMNDFYKSGINKKCDMGLLDPMEAIEPFLKRMRWIGTSREYFLTQYEFEAQYIDFELLDRIAALNKSGTKCYIASNQNYFRKEFLKMRMNLNTNFSGLFFSSEIGHAKPEDGYWTHVITRLNEEIPGIQNQQILFLDDLEENVASAAKVGITAIQIKTAIDIHEAFRLIEDSLVTTV